MTGASVLTEAAVLAQVNKVVGVIIAMIGAIVAAPDGALLLYRSFTARVRAMINKFRNRSTPAAKVSGSFHGTLPAMTMTASGRVWRPDDPIDARIDALRAHISDVEGRLSETRNALNQERDARESAIAELGRDLHARLDELHQLLQEKERQMATIDARGLPVIGFGILLSGVPEFLAELPRIIGWALPFAGFAWMVVAVLDSVRRRHSRSAAAS